MLPLRTLLFSLALSPWGAAPQDEALVAPDPDWIWTSGPIRENSEAFFALAFELDQPAQLVKGAFVADDTYRLWFDGKLLESGSDFLVPTWFRAGARMAKGSHAIAVAASNLEGPAGLVGYLELELLDGSTRILQTSDKWRSWEQMPALWPNLVAPLPRGQAAKALGKASLPTEPWGDVLGLAGPPDPASFNMPDDFVCERIYAARTGEGSWASMTFSDDGHLYVSGERGPLFEFTLGEGLLRGAPAKPVAQKQGPLVQGISEAKRVPLPVHSAQGLEWAHGALYVVQSTDAERQGGLHKLTDTDGDGTLDRHEQLASFGTQSEHGAHGIRLAPDGSLYLLTGNYVRFPSAQEKDGQLAYLDADCPPHGEEDVLLPRISDPLGHAAGIMAPGAQLWRTDANGEVWEQVASGMRNPYDLAITQAGDIFTYDADMEWDLGAPWYRSPRILHLIPGGEYGWRAGTAKWPASYPDSLPPLAETDLASPTGIELTAGSNFSAKYQNALLLGDWAWGRITIAALEPAGATYSATVSTLLEGRGLAITDMEIGPDGWLWFITGGRGTQSAVFRLRQEGQASTRMQRAAPDTPDAHQLRRALLADNCPPELALASIDAEDAFLRTSARLALEDMAPALWLPQGNRLSPTFALPLARAWPEVLASKLKKDDLEIAHWFRDGRALEKVELERAVRTAMVVHMRVDADAIASAEAIWIADLAELFPTDSKPVNREIARLLTALNAPGLPALFLAEMHAGASQEHQLHFALLLRLVTSDWTGSTRATYFSWFQAASHFQGGASLAGFLAAIGNEALANVPQEQADQVTALMKTESPSAPVPSDRVFVREWSAAELVQAIKPYAASADPTRGATIFREASCFQCHRIDGSGGALGPDLTSVARRFSQRDILTAIADPTKSVSDQYRLIQMPTGLLDRFSAAEVADLEAFLEFAQWPVK